VIVPATAAVALPDDIPWPLAALLACGGQTGLGSAFNTAPVTRGNRVIILGCGPVGLCVVMACRFLGAATAGATAAGAGIRSKRRPDAGRVKRWPGVVRAVVHWETLTQWISRRVRSMLP